MYVLNLASISIWSFFLIFISVFLGGSGRHWDTQVQQVRHSGSAALLSFLSVTLGGRRREQCADHIGLVLLHHCPIHWMGLWKQSLGSSTWQAWVLVTDGKHGRHKLTLFSFLDSDSSDKCKIDATSRHRQQTSMVRFQIILRCFHKFGAVGGRLVR